MLFKIRFSNIDYIKKVNCPILFIHGQKDELIPFEHTMKLKEACSCPVEILLPEEMDHNTFDYDSDLLIPLKDFYRRYTDYNNIDRVKLTIPSFLYNIPKNLKDEIEKSNKKERIIGCFGDIKS